MVVTTTMAQLDNLLIHIKTLTEIVTKDTPKANKV